MSQTGTKALVDLLQSLFSADELRRFVALLPDGNLALALPSGSASVATLAFEVVDVLARHGLLDGVFFELLGNERPARRDEITRVRALLIDPMTSARPAALPPAREHERTASFLLDPLAQKLERALARKQRLEDAGQPTDDILAEIRELKREHRRGGQLRRGDALGERYLLIEPIGRGGFATVWRARDSVCGEDVAIKVLHPELAGDVIRRQRFLRGARIMAELAHPIVVRIREREAEDDGFFYFVMDFVPGGNLQDAVLEGRLNGEQAVPLILSIGDALAQAHARGHVHRDIKPVNILLTESGAPRLTDFDLVTAQDTTGGTRTGALGTFIYAAPEMMERPQDADARADVYGLGMTVAFMLHGAILPRKALTARERFIEELGCPPALEAVLKRATAEDPADRHHDAATFGEALRGAASLGRHRAKFQPPETVAEPAADVTPDMDIESPPVKMTRKQPIRTFEVSPGGAGPSATPEPGAKRGSPFLANGASPPTKPAGVDVRDIMSVLASSRTMRGAALETARSLEGVWKNPTGGSVYCISLLEDRLIAPYCWGGNDYLTATWYDCVMEGNKLHCHFRWLSGLFRGHVSMRIASRDRLVGYWWEQDCELDCSFPDGPRDGREKYMPLVLTRQPRQRIPEWAAAYLRNGGQRVSQ